VGLRGSRCSRGTCLVVRGLRQCCNGRENDRGSGNECHFAKETLSCAAHNGMPPGRLRAGACREVRGGLLESSTNGGSRGVQESKDRKVENSKHWRSRKMMRHVASVIMGFVG